MSPASARSSQQGDAGEGREQLGRVSIQRGKSGSPSRDHEDKMQQLDHLGAFDLLFQNSPTEMISL